jgi:hypothetical protein
MRALLRVALGCLALQSAVIGAQAAIAPRSFYDGFPFGRGWVELLPPFNEHLVTDVGGFYLAFAVLFTWAAVTLARALVVPLCVAWIAASSLHTLYHVLHLDGFTAGDAIAQTAGFAVVLVLPVLALRLARDVTRAAA